MTSPFIVRTLNGDSKGWSSLEVNRYLPWSEIRVEKAVPDRVESKPKGCRCT